MKKILLSFIFTVAALANSYADNYTGILVTDGDQRICYLFEERPTVKYKIVDCVMNYEIYINGNADPVVCIPMKNGAKLTVNFGTFTRVNLNSAGYATFSCKDATFVATSGVTAYKAVVNGELITLTALEGNIPAGTGILLYGETPGTNVDMHIATTGTNADMTDNSLKPTTLENGSLAGFESNSWALGDGTKFLRYTGSAYVHNRAYLIHSHPKAKAMQMVFNGEYTPTDIDSTVSETSPRDGKFIEDGRIVIRKNGIKYNVAGQVIK